MSPRSAGTLGGVVDELRRGVEELGLACRLDPGEAATALGDRDGQKAGWDRRYSTGGDSLVDGMEGFADRIDPFGEGMEAFGEGIDPFADRMDPFGEGIDPFADRMDPFGEGMEAFGEGIDPFADRMDPFGEGIDPFADRMDERDRELVRR